MAVDPNVGQSGQVRIFIQSDGPSPSNPYEYYGAVQMGEAQESYGERTTILLPSSTQRNKWDIVGSSAAAPELGSVDFTFRMDKFLRDVWWDLKQRANCLFNMKAVLSDCARPDDQYNFDGVIAYKGTNLTSLTVPEMNNLEGESVPLDGSGSLQFESLNPIRRLKWAEKAEAAILAEVIDGIYFDQVSCGDCGTLSDGCKTAYVLTISNGGSPGLSSQIVHTTDKWKATAQALDIATLGGKSASALAGMGLYIVVVSETDGAHHVILETDARNNTQAFTRVATGYVGGASPRCIYTHSSAKALIGAQGGYIYKLENPTGAVVPVADGAATSQNINAIDGRKDCIVTVGNSNAVLASQNGGETFSLVTGPVPGSNLLSVEVINNRLWFVGAADGKLYYTTNEGVSWTEKVITTAGLTSVNDIWFVDDIVGYVAVQSGANGAIYRTIDGGYSWQNTAPSIQSLPTAERYNFVNACDYNKVMAGGRVSSAGDGVLVITE